jgi:hypothetical protein
VRHPAAIVVLALALSGCSYVADVPLIGVPSNAPKRPKGPGAFLPVHDVQVLDVNEQTRIYNELNEAREKGKATAASDAAAIAASQPPAKPAAPAPAKKKKKAEK